VELPDEEEMYPIVKEYIDDYRQEIPIEWEERESREAASILAGVTSIEAENVMAALIAKKNITKADLDEVRFAKDRLFADISGLEKIEVTTVLTGWDEEEEPIELQPEDEDEVPNVEP
jgi:hypothetical protein